MTIAVGVLGALALLRSPRPPRVEPEQVLDRAPTSLTDGGLVLARRA